jgi:hypothetical protein
MSSDKIDPLVLEKARKAYMDYIPVTEIARELGLNRNSLQYHVDKKWRDDREISRIELLDYMLAGKKKDIMSMTNSSIKIIARALKDLADSAEPPSIRDAAKISGILETLDKITRLDDNKPTEIISDQALTTVEIRKKLMLDPFAPKEVEFEEVKEDN